MRTSTTLIALGALGAALAACTNHGIPSQAGSPAYAIKQAKVRELTTALNFSEHESLRDLGPSLTQMNLNMSQAGSAAVLAQVGAAASIGAGSLMANGAASVLAGGARSLQMAEPEAPSRALLQSEVKVTTDPLSGELTGLSKGGVVLAFAFSGLGQARRDWEMKLTQAPDGSVGRLKLGVEAGGWEKAPQEDPRFRVMGGQVPVVGTLRGLWADFEAIPQNRMLLRLAGKLALDEPKALPGSSQAQASHLNLSLVVAQHDLSVDLRTDGELVTATGALAAPNRAGVVQRFTYALNHAPRTQVLRLSVDHPESGVRLMAEGKVNTQQAWQRQDLTAGLYAIEDGVKIADLRPDPKDPKAIAIAYTDGSTYVWAQN